VENACEVNPGVQVNLWLVNPRANLSMEQLALKELELFLKEMK